jgi:beta-lactamase class A
MQRSFFDAETAGKCMSNGKWMALMALGMLAAASVTWLALKPALDVKKQIIGGEVKQELAVHESLPCDDVSIVRDNSPSLTKPMLLTEVNCESDALQSLKNELTAYIDSQKVAGKISRASVYFKELNSLHWTAAYGEESYYPGSMLKVALMLTVLKQAQRDKTLLERQVQFVTPGKMDVQVPVSSPMQVGNLYTVQELIERMIVQSDNDATTLLFSMYDRALYDDLFAKLSIQVQNPEDRFYQVHPADIAKFFRVLYNASFLSSLYSEYALSLLAKSEFNRGILQGVSSDTKVAHKFGERYTTSDLVQLHETAIVYRGPASYVICVMTEGKKMDDLAPVIGGLSRICFTQKRAQMNDVLLENKKTTQLRS